MFSLTRFKRMDVRCLLQRGVEPLPEFDRRVATLKADEGLVVIAPFLPSPLIERLRSEGFTSKLQRGRGSDWVVYFWRDAV